MSEKDTKITDLKNEQTEKTNVREFTLDDSTNGSISSAEPINTEQIARKISIEDEKNYSTARKDVPSDLAQSDSIETENPIFKELAEPKLPEPAKENRARLQMQSPTRLHFYWSFKNNPFKPLHQIFGKNTGNYTLVVKLLNQTADREEIVPVENDGSTWFDVDAGATYRAEIGFYAANRPFVRVMFSNTIETPRKNSSSRRDYSPHFNVSAEEFAEVLDASGFRQDAFEVALAGDDFAAAASATQNAFSQFVGKQKSDYQTNDASEIRFALLTIASGVALENLRGQISKNLFSELQKNAGRLSVEKAFAALQENFGVFSDEMTEEEFFAPTVFGASLVNFPRMSKRKFLPKFAPVSSFRRKEKLSADRR